MGFLSLFRGDYEEAISWCKRAVEKNPGHALLAGFLGEVLNFSGEPRMAAMNARKAIGLMPVYPGWFKGVLGVAHRLSGNLSDAENDLRNGIARDPKSQDARLNLIAVLVERGEKKEAQDNATEFMSLNPAFSVRDFAPTQPYKDPDVLEGYLSSLHNAGLPE